MICLDLENKDIKDWVDGIGIDDTYKHFILHNYRLPKYKAFQQSKATATLTRTQIESILDSMLNLKNYSIESIDKIRSFSKEGLAAFMDKSFYFAKSANLLQVNEEAFHAIFQTLTTSEEERNKLLAIAESLLNERLKKQNLSKNALLEKFSKITNLKGSALYNYVLEEELAAEWVFWSTYEGSEIRENALRKLWKNKDSSFIDKVIESLKVLFNRLKAFVQDINKSDYLKHYFNKIKSGQYRLDNPVLENDFGYEYPSFSPIKLEGEQGQFLMDTLQQQLHYSKIHALYEQLLKQLSFKENGDRYTTSELLNEAIDIYRDSVLSKYPEGTEESIYAMMLEIEDDEEFEPRTQTFEEIRERVLKSASASTELEDEIEKNEDDMGGAFNDFQSDTSNMIDRFSSLPRRIKQMMYTIPVIENGVETIEKEFIENGETKTIQLQTYRMADPHRIYSAIVRATTNSIDEFTRLKKLVLFSEDSVLNSDTNAFVEYFLKRIFNVPQTSLSRLKEEISSAVDLEYFSENGTSSFKLKDEEHFSTVLKAFDLWTRPNFISVENIKEAEDGGMNFNPNMTNVESNQIGKWFENWSTKKRTAIQLRAISGRLKDPMFLEQKLRNVSSLNLETMMQKSFENFDAITKFLGIEVSQTFLKYVVTDAYIKNLLDESEQGFIPQKFMTIYNSFQLSETEFKMDYAGLSQAFKVIVDSVDSQALDIKEWNPYEVSFDTLFDAEGNPIADEGIMSKIKPLAKGNAYFDESVLSSTFLNSDGKNIYAHQQKTLILQVGNYVTKSEKNLRAYNQELLEYSPFHSYTSGEGNLLFDYYLSLTDREKSRLNVISYAGVQVGEYRNGKKQKNLREVVNEITSKDFVAVQANTAVRELYISKQAKKQDQKYIEAAKLTTKYFLGYPEASNTKTFFSGVWLKGDSIGGQFVPLLKTDNTLSLSGINQAYKFIEQQALRAKDVYDFLNQWDLEHSNFQKNEKGIITITEKALRSTPLKSGEMFVGNIGDGFLTGKLKIEDGKIDTDFMANNLRVLPRGLTITTSLNGFLNKETDKKLIYDQFLFGEENTTKIKESIRKGINNLLADTDSQLTSNLYSSEYWGMGDQMVLNFLGFKKAATTRDAEGNLPKPNKNIFQHNLRLFFLNSLFNREAFHRIVAGDSAINNKNDFLDQSKRLKGAEGQIVSAYTTVGNEEKGVDAFTKLNYVQMVEAAKGKVKPYSGVTGDAIDSDDAQSYTSVNHRRLLLHGLRKLDNDAVIYLDKLESGRAYTAEDDKKALKTDLLLNIEKTRGFGPTVDLKTSEAMLHKLFTSRKIKITGLLKEEIDSLITETRTLKGQSYKITSKEGATREITVEYDNFKYKSWEDAFDANAVNVFEWKADSLELHEKRLLLDGWRKKGDKWVKTENLINVISPTSAHKRMKQNIWDGNPESFEDFNVQSASTRYYGRQVENPAHNKITDPSQELEIITSSLNDLIEFKDSFGNVITRDKNTVIEGFYNLLKTRDLNTFEQALNEITNNEGDPYLKTFYTTIQERLQETGGDRQLLELFSVDEIGDPLYNPNIQIVKNKFENYFFSHFSKGVLAQKVQGDALAMMSPKGYSALKRLQKNVVNGKVIYNWEVITKSNPMYNTYYEQAKEDFTLKGLTYNGYTANNETTVASYNTLITELDKLENGDFFLDELRHLVPEIERSENNDLVINKEMTTKITGYFSEAVLPKRDVKQKELEKSWQFVHGVRIPSQDKATSANLKIVDLLETTMSNSVMVSKEIQELAGSDFDIDKLYVQFVEGYWESNKFFPYQRVESKDYNFEQYKHYTFKNNRYIKDKFKEYINQSDAYNEYMSNIAELEKEFKESLKSIESDFSLMNKIGSELKQLFRVTDKNQEDWDYLYDLTDSLRNLRQIAKEANLDEERTNLLEKIAEINIQVQKVRGIVENKILYENKLPYDADTYSKAPREYNNGLINNQLLNYKIALLSNKIEAYSNTTDVGSLKDVDKNSPLGILRDIEKEDEEFARRIIDEPNLKRKDVVVYRIDFNKEPYIPYHSPLFDEYYGTKIQAAKVGIGASVNANLTYLVLSRLNMQLNPAYHIELQMEKDDDVITFFEYAETSPEYTNEPYDISRWISTLVSVTTDEGKEGVLAKYNILGDLLAVFATGQQIGIHPEVLVALVNNPVLQDLAIQSIRNPLQVKKQSTLLDLVNEKISNLKDAGASDEVLDINTLKYNLLRTDIKAGAADYSTLVTVRKLLSLYNQNRDLVKFIRLKRGFDATYNDFVSLTESVQKLNLDIADFYKERRDELPVVELYERHDVYDLKASFDNPQIQQLKNYIDEVIPKVYTLANKLLIEGNSSYRKIYNKVVNTFDVTPYKKADFDKEVEVALLGELLAEDPNYNLSVDLVVGEQSLAKRLLTLLADDLDKPKKKQLKNYPLFKKLTARVGLNKALTDAQRRNPKLKREDLLDKIKTIDIDTVNLNLFAKLAPELQTALMDDYQHHSLSKRKEIKDFVRDLFNYYIIKDGMRYSPTGLSKIFPTYMFSDVSKKYDEFLSKKLDDADIQIWSDNILKRLTKDTRLSEFMKFLPPMEKNENDFPTNSKDTFEITIEGKDVQVPYWKMKSGSMFVIRKPSNQSDTYINDMYPKGLPKAFTKPTIQGENPSTYLQVGAVAKGSFIEYIYLEKPAMGTKGLYSTLANGNFSFSTLRLTQIRNNLRNITEPAYQMYIEKHLVELNDMIKVQIPYSVNKEAIDYYFRNSSPTEFVQKINELKDKGKEFTEKEVEYIKQLYSELKVKYNVDNLWEEYKDRILQKNPKATKEDLEKQASQKGTTWLKDYLNKCYK